jgi:hypothetical protein
MHHLRSSCNVEVTARLIVQSTKILTIPVEIWSVKKVRTEVDQMTAGEKKTIIDPLLNMLVIIRRDQSVRKTGAYVKIPVSAPNHTDCARTTSKMPSGL